VYFDELRNITFTCTCQHSTHLLEINSNVYSLPGTLSDLVIPGSEPDFSVGHKHSSTTVLPNTQIIFSVLNNCHSHSELTMQ